MATRNTGKDLPGGTPVNGAFGGKPAGINGAAPVSMASLATSCPWVIKSLGQNSTFYPVAQDLPPRKPVKGGRLVLNDNLTLVRTVKRN